jgi:transcriptional regulator with XRE-family HTH domain
MDDTKTTMGMRIAAMRGFRRMTQDELGNAVGVTKQTVSGWEHGRRAPDSDLLAGICKTLDCSADYLLGLADRPDGMYKGESGWS